MFAHEHRRDGLMPKKRWSAKDERKYKAILKSCTLSRGRKKGVTKACKRIAAATVERDIALEGLRGLGSSYGDSVSAPIRGLGAIPARGLGAQLLSVRLRGPGSWRSLQSVDPNAESGVYQQKGDRFALITEDPDEGDYTLGIYRGEDMGSLEQLDYSSHPTQDAAERAARSYGFDGLRGTPAQHRRQAELLMSEANSSPLLRSPEDQLEYAARASEEAQWTGDPALDRKADRFLLAHRRSR